MTSPRPQIPKLVLESMDGSERIPLDGTQGFIRMPGSAGLEMPPFEVITSAIPGVSGAQVEDIRVQQRPVFIPIYIGADGDMPAFREMLRRLHSIVNPLNKKAFRLVGESASGSREMVVTYTGGLEGSDAPMDSGLAWTKIGLNVVASSPFASARADRTLEFRYEITPEPFLGVVGGTDTPWPRSVVTTAVIGEGMEVAINSEVPVYPTLELIGPMDSFSGDLSPVDVSGTSEEWSISVPLGVPTTSTMRLVTDPRIRSYRLDGALAAGRIALGSKVRPFYPGQNILNVAAPGSTESTLIRLSWRDLFWSLW